ncbi:MAG TPA: hypothetical protein DDY70_04690 [Clostridiales bacterium]|mgnify:CR=1 FL=1|nr:hypothetical protein [Clostridiales bacterium]
MGRPKARRGVRVALFSVLLTLCILCLLLWVALIVSDANIKPYSPTEEKADIETILRQESLSEEDYSLLYCQTGLTKIGIDRALEHGEQGIQRVLDIQRQYFTEHEVEHDNFAPLMCTDFLADGKHVRNIYLEEGDILITSSTHFSAFRMGHAGIVTDADRGEVLQAAAYGQMSRIGRASEFTDRVSFMILRPKAGTATGRTVAKYARENLSGIPYNAFAGIFSDKNSVNTTQCAHLVWYAYHTAAGIDLTDKTIILPYGLANSDELEVVQVFGFDPDTLWSDLFY